MCRIADPMFALILRFVGHNQDIDFFNDDFVQKQLKAIKAYVDKFPEAEQDWRAIEWIEKYARQYRRNWEKEILTHKFSSKRCPDCPLSEVNILGHCQIHDQWLELLQQYVAHEIDSSKYIKRTLKLLAQHKEDLRIKLSVLEENG